MGGESSRRSERYQESKPHTPGPREGAFSVKRWFQASIGDAVNQAAQTYPSVFRGAMRSFNLMETPGAFLAERKTQGLVLWTLLTEEEEQSLKVCRWAKPWGDASAS